LDAKRPQGKIAVAELAEAQRPGKWITIAELGGLPQHKNDLSVKTPLSPDKTLISHHLSVKMPVFTDKVQREGD
jgi:hypothetical protein